MQMTTMVSLLRVMVPVAVQSVMRRIISWVLRPVVVNALRRGRVRPRYRALTGCRTGRVRVRRWPASQGVVVRAVVATSGASWVHPAQCAVRSAA